MLLVLLVLLGLLVLLVVVEMQQMCAAHTCHQVASCMAGRKPGEHKT